MKTHIFRLSLTIGSLALTGIQGLAQTTFELYTFTTLAGLGGSQGSADGTGSVARFQYLNGAAVDSAGNVYAADTENHTIRKITPTGVVTTLAGLAGSPGSADGTGIGARFKYPYSVAVDSTGNVYVADRENHTIRKVTPVGVVTTLAGSAGNEGSANGTGSAARFRYPQSVAVDGAGNVYVADTFNAAIRKVTPSGVVTTLAGSPGKYGSTDGTASAARFGGGYRGPTGVAVDNAGNVYVADSPNNTLRKVTPAGVVTTLAGLAQYNGNGDYVTNTFSSVDGTGSAARFADPSGVGVDSAGNLYVADIWTIRKVTSAGVVTTLAGSEGNFGSADGTGSAALFNYPSGVAVDSAGNLYVADTQNNTIRKGFPPVGPPVVRTQPQSQMAERNPEVPVTFSVAVSGSAPMAYQWRKDGTDITGATNSSLSLLNLQASDAGAYSVVATNVLGTATSSDAMLTTFVRPPQIATQPQDQTVTQTYPHTLSVEVTGTLPMAYQWRKDGANVAGATNASFSIANFQSIDTGAYSVVVTNPYGSVTSSNAVMTLTFPYTFATIAGMAINRGSADGTGSVAQFYGPSSVAVDSAGNTYVADSYNNTIRKITPTGVVMTLAGLAQYDVNGNYVDGSQGSADGTGSAARFYFDYRGGGVAVDGAGNLYVADTRNNTIRKVTPVGTNWVVTTLAGLAPQYDTNGNFLAGGDGSVDGTGSGARFSQPSGVAVDGAGNVYVADTYNDTIRKVIPVGTNWVVATLAGLAPQYDTNGNLLAGGSGSLDGTGSAARFSSPQGVAVDSAGNVYVADSGNGTIRKVTPTGVVTTLAGTAPYDVNGNYVYGSQSSLDGTGSAARFNWPQGVAVDKDGNVLVADTDNLEIRKVTQAGVVTTLAGLAGSGGSADGTGSFARFGYIIYGEEEYISGPSGITVDSAGNVYVADTYNTIRKGIAAIGPPAILTQPLSQTLPGTYDVSLSVFAGGTLPLTYQWRKDGTNIEGATNASYTLANLQDNAGGAYTVVVGNASGSIISSVAALTVTLPYTFTTLAGNAFVGSVDGPGSTARFQDPMGVAVDGDGNVYVADASNNTIRKVTSAGVVTTLAGSAGQYGSTDGTGSAARFSSPQGVAVDSAGNVYVADSGNGTIRKVTVAGVVTTLAAGISYPFGVAVDSTGNVYVADDGNNTIRKVTPAGVVTTLAGSASMTNQYGPVGGYTDGTGSAARFNSPRGLAVDSAGNVYVADQWNHAIRKIAPTGLVTTLAGNASITNQYGPVGGYMDGTGSAARFNSPLGVAVDSTGNVYVADRDNNTIRKVTTVGVVTTLAGLNWGSADGTGTAAQFRNPSSVAVDSAGNLYVADTQNNTIRKVTTAGVVTTLAGVIASRGAVDAPGSAARFSLPNGVAVDASGNVYVGDSYNSTIRKMTPAGVVTTLAGLAGTQGSTDGTGSDARFYQPDGVAVDSAGNVYVADNGNNTIRKVTPAGTVTTLAGSAGQYGSTDGTGSAARFSNPTGVAVDNAGNVYVGDYANDTIRKVTPAGVVTLIATLPGNPGNNVLFEEGNRVAVDNAGNVYSADTGNRAIRKLTPVGTNWVITTVAQGIAAVSLAVDGAGNLYLTEDGSGAIHKLTPGGLMTTVAGLTFTPGFEDGTGSAARFGTYEWDNAWVLYGPTGIAADSAGNLYVADTFNNTIRKGYLGYPSPTMLTFGSASGFNLDGSGFTFNLTGPAGQSVVVEASTDMVNWLPIWTNTFTGTLPFSDPQSGAFSRRFYRTRTP